MAAEVIQPAESLPARLAGVWPLSRVTAKVTLEVGFSLHHMAAERALEPHPGQVICILSENNGIFKKKIKVVSTNALGKGVL